ncbi:hypothetical protein RF11_04781 [Thelohanellus kitauei]|uniref:Uncharacterized protein n=1 Tax=Thelohanellus kitauei TaxID=669202 RepID=A0A0C2MDX3_THEKT|nr:hypothetical protein RF11_04781 [Thelohanellus kitauei]
MGDDVCILDDFFFPYEIQEFFKYLKSKSIPKDDYPRMMFSAQCNIFKSTDEHYRRSITLKNQRDMVVKYLVANRNTTKGSDTTDEYLIKGLEKHSVLNGWTKDRLLFKIIQCYLQNDNLDKAMKYAKSREHADLYNPDPSHNQYIKPTNPYDATHTMAPFFFILCSVIIAIGVVWVVHYKRGVVNRYERIEFQGNGIYWPVRENLIVEE